MKEVVFPTTPENDFKVWYERGNSLSGQNEYYLFLKRLKLSTGESDGKKTQGKIDFSAQIFQKKPISISFCIKRILFFLFRIKKFQK